MEGVERVWHRRLRWRLRGAWQWPAFVALTLVDGDPAHRAAAVLRRRPARLPGRAARGLREPARDRRRWRRRRAAGCAAAGRTCRARWPPTTPGRRCWSAIAVLLGAGGLLHRSAVRGTRTRACRPSPRRCTTTWSRRRREYGGSLGVDRRDPPRCGLLPRVRPGRRAEPLVLPVREHRPAPAGDHARHRRDSQPRLPAVRRLRLAEVALLHDHVEAVDARLAAVEGDLDRVRVAAVVGRAAHAGAPRAVLLEARADDPPGPGVRWAATLTPST